MNVEFSASFCEPFISSLSDDAPYKELRKLAEAHGVPSLELSACQALRNIASVKRPEKSIDIGCGIGVSTLAILSGCPGTEHTAVDGNLERILIFNEFFKGRPNVKSRQMRGEQWLTGCADTYDLAFVDSVKREYSIIWQRLRPKLNEGAVAVFDDVLLYGYVCCQEAEVPAKYRSNRLEMINFLTEIFSDASLSAQIIPVSGGMLVISLP